MADTLVGEIFDNFCRHREYLMAAIAILSVLFLLSVVGISVIPSDSPGYVVGVMNLFGLGAFLLFFSGIVIYCYRSDRIYK